MEPRPGTPPPGVGLSATGLLGHADAVGAWTFTVLAREGSRSDTKTLTLTVVEQLVASGRHALPRRGQQAVRVHADGAGRAGASHVVARRRDAPTRPGARPGHRTIRGIPLAAGTFPLQLSRRTPPASQRRSRRWWSARKLAITIRLRAGVEGRRYSTLLTKVGGVGPFVYRIVGGRLPVGVARPGDGPAERHPAPEGIFRFTVRVPDSLGAISTKPLRLTILP